VLTALFVQGQGAQAGTNRFTAELISKSEPLTNISRVLWHPLSRHVTYLRSNGTAKNITNVLCSYDVSTGGEAVLFEPPAGTNHVHLSLSSYQWSPDGSAILVSGDQDLWLVPIPQDAPKRLTRDTEAEELPTFSPDGQRIALIRKNNLFTIDVKSGRQKQVTFDGDDLVLNGKLDWVYREEFSHTVSSGRAYEWSPDGNHLVFLQLDDRRVPEYPLTDFLRTRPTVKYQRYPKAGDTNPAASVRSVDVTKANPRVLIMPSVTNTEYVVPEFSWTPDSRSVAVMTLNRGQNEVSIFVWETSGRSRPRLLLRETDSAWLNVFDPPLFLGHSAAAKRGLFSARESGPDGAFKSSRAKASVSPLVWLSERDGWLHAYLFNADGKSPRQLTRGPWQIEANFSPSWSEHGLEIDPDNRWAYFSATDPDPRERHLYRTRLDGTALERLTREPGTHYQKLSPDGRHLLETFSSVDRPPTIRVLRSDGTVVATLDQQADRWSEFATAASEFHEVFAPDGAKLYAQLIKPAEFNPSKKYPVIIYVYGGPQAQVVRNQWPAVSPRLQLLAQEGFLIWSLDNRGSWGRGHAWETQVFRNLGTNELSDQLAGLAHLRTLPFVDTNRFGIFGWSYGGYMTLYALTHASDVFKCGVAGAPVTDWKFYDTIYTERYMRMPKENPSGYKTSSPLAAAPNLKAKVLLIHGTADDNVHMQNTMNFLDALTKADRPYELQIQPGQTHGFGGETANRFLAEQIVDFFKRHL
jgi:dipeptidyl-peptidase-4